MTALTFFLMPSETTLYNEATLPVVDLPAGYFVMQSDADAPSGYLAVVYDDLSGFVKKDAVQAVDYIPVTKYETTVRFYCDNDGQPVNLRKSPSRSADIVAVLSATESGRCYGSRHGDALITGAGDVWYYVKTETQCGYCYSAHVRVDPTPPNIIEKEEPTVTDPVIDQPTDEQEQPPQTMSTTAAIIFTVALCVPVPFIMYFLFRKPKDDE